jgi:hypothetical protein
LNVEPDPTALMKRGFLTPSSLHYVRNHGPVPKISWADHKVLINGLVDRPLVLSMDQIAAMPQVNNRSLEILQPTQRKIVAVPCEPPTGIPRAGRMLRRRERDNICWSDH